MTDVLRSPLGEAWSLAPAVPFAVPRLEPEAAVPPRHVVQFYESAPFLLDAARDFLAVGLRLGQAVVVIATPGHRAALDARLVADGMDVEAARVRGQYVALDAAETLAAFMVDGAPDAERFERVVGGVIARAAEQHQQVRAFGEMVTLLAADGQYEAAIRLEQLWNGLQERYGFSLLCGYPMDILGGEQVAALVERICDTHGRVVPAESYSMLVAPDQQQRAIALLQQKAQSLQAEVVERQHAEDALHSLFRISQKLHTTLDLDTLLTQLVEESLRLVGAEGGCAGLRGPAGMVCQGYVRPTGAIPLDYVWRPGHGLPGWLLEHRRPYLTNDARRDPQIVQELCAQFGVWSALSTPILDADGEVLGFFELHNKADGSGFTSADVEKVVAVSQIASVALQNARSYREAQDAIRLRDELLAIASHELRTPLTTVSAHAQLMLRRLARDGAADPVAVERSFGMIAQQAGKLTRLIEQLLDVSRLEAGRVTLARQMTDVGDLLQRVIGAAEVRTQQRIVARVPTGVWAWVDPLRLDQMVTNLLDNAIKYGAEDQPIEVALCGTADDPGGQIEISVRDYGDGIPAEIRPRLFERFFQAHAEGYKSGMGLGLFISRQVAELHGGQIEAEAPSDGGTRFVIRLPATPETSGECPGPVPG